MKESAGSFSFFGRLKDRSGWLCPITANVKTKSILDSFQTFYYEDEEVPAVMPYNLCLPKDYDASQKYPMVVFIGDASANTDDSLGALYQGNGGTIWATVPCCLSVGCGGNGCHEG